MVTLLTRINSITSTGVNLMVKATPWVINITAGGADQLITTILMGGLHLVSGRTKNSYRNNK